jgi:hypothetical protein
VAILRTARITRPGFIMFASLAMLAALLVATAQPAAAHSRNEAVTNACGSGYSIVNDGVRDLTYLGSKWGEVVLAYNSSTGRNCAVAFKTTSAGYHGTPSRIYVSLEVQGDKVYHNNDMSASHWERVTANAAGKCVKFGATIWSPDGQRAATGGRSTWGNCG